ncbi:hypothetical protein P153DRAFT_339355 [Dothidotthia symphoricarpi CBS 119687]|uniref:Uncharacterized protein n=1 Tax=Dothidotthia symphoricarpi CBS 119687 TaxID=1392245 RepID=A0A6A6AG20_9PLEO|nr:uncharacterized protein P153DRAFT_339355 [Dothidotthia symphoricarpi CBS 119687]KAF2129978.1 hypothetical protein P153DRAFT_339355 [Dothidotthia symphoricarpi CBS 119687]
MPTNIGVNWHRKIHSKPKDAPPPLKISADDLATVSEDASDRRRHHGWRIAVQGSRPATPVSTTPASATPVSIAPTTPVVEDRGDRSEMDARSDRSGAATPGWNSRPNASRYTTLFNNFKETSRESEFTEPWSEYAPPPYQPTVDPLGALQSIRSYMLSQSSKPIPLDYHCGLFRIFEDYRNSKNEKEQLEILFEKMCKDWTIEEQQWAASQRRYEADVHRLRMLLAQGTNDVTNLKDGQEIKTNSQRKTVETDRLPPTLEALSHEQIDEQLRFTIQRARLQRPKSPSATMTALSKQFTAGPTDLLIGAPPSINRRTTLSRKVQNEVNSDVMGQIETSHPASDSVNSSFSGTGDPLPDEIAAHTTAPINLAAECEALVELRDLGKLVALRKGLKVDVFVNGLMKLFAETDVVDCNERLDEDACKEKQLQSSPLEDNRACRLSSIEETLTSTPTLRRLQSQPQLGSDQKHRRHFSFEPGDDWIQALEEKRHSYDMGHSCDDSSESECQPSVSSRIPILESQLEELNRSPQTLHSDVQKPSKIPSPMGRVRRENSASSLQSVFLRSNQDLRRDSRSSILTAFRNSSSGNLQPSKSRCSSIHDLRTAESPLASKGQSHKLRVHNSAIPKAKEHADQSAALGGGSPTQSSTGPSIVGSPARQTRSMCLVKSENNESYE